MCSRYGAKEFEVTTDRLGCYEPTEHIDNPLGYAEGRMLGIMIIDSGVQLMRSVSY